MAAALTTQTSQLLAPPVYNESYRLQKAMEALERSDIEQAPPLATPPVFVNHTVPAQYQARGRRVSYRRSVMGQLYAGSWRYSNAMSNAYPAMHSFLLLAIASTYQVMNVVCNAKALVALEFILCWILRLRNQHHLVTFNVAASLYLYHYGASGHVWAFLSHLRLTCSKPWTKRFAVEMAALSECHCSSMRCCCESGGACPPSSCGVGWLL